MLDNLKLPNETIDKVYDDIAHPVASEAGKFLRRIPRAINAALMPVDKWIIQQEYNIEATKTELELKLKNIDPEHIVPPEPYIAVPALQSISYCMSNKELYDLYANLLAKAMVSDTKDFVHPSFVEIIKQLAPNDALVLKQFISSEQSIAAAIISLNIRKIGLNAVNREQFSYGPSDLVTNIQINSLSEEQIKISIDNLKRLGLIEILDRHLINESDYEFVKASGEYERFSEKFHNWDDPQYKTESIFIDKKMLITTPLGNKFCDICILGFDSE